MSLKSHALEIERGRYTSPKTPVNERLCSECKVVENEVHFFLYCQLYRKERQELFDKVTEMLPNFPLLPDANRLIFLLCNEHDVILSWVGKFIFNSFKKRTEHCEKQ